MSISRNPRGSLRVISVVKSYRKGQLPGGRDVAAETSRVIYVVLVLRSLVMAYRELIEYFKAYWSGSISRIELMLAVGLWIRGM